MGRAADFIADIFLPNRCPCCGGFIKWDALLCGSCQERLVYFDNSDSRPPKGCSASVSVFEFREPANQGIYALKDGWGRNFVKFGAGKLAEILSGSGADLVTCVPMAKRKRAERGFDQAELIGRELAERLGLPFDAHILARRPASLEQHALSGADREEFAKALYFIPEKHGDVSGKKLLLVDDVRTTGSTLSVCASLLLETGAAEVIAAALCGTVLGAVDESQTK